MKQFFVNLLYQQCFNNILFDQFERLGINLEIIDVDIFNEVLDQMGIDDDVDREILALSFDDLCHQVLKAQAGKRLHLQLKQNAPVIKKQIENWIESIHIILESSADSDSQSNSQYITKE